MRRMIVLVVVTAALAAFVVQPASAAVRVECVANGFVDITGDGPYTWVIQGNGTCLDSLQGNFLVSLFGIGRSDTLGLCDGLLVQNLGLFVRETFTNLRTLSVTTQDELWGSPVSTFPIVTPVLITSLAGDLKGAGAIATRVLGQCPPGGNHVATFVFTTTGG